MPLVELTAPDGSTWSWDRYRLGVTRYKKTIADAAVDGVIPEEDRLHEGGDVSAVDDRPQAVGGAAPGPRRPSRRGCVRSTVGRPGPHHPLGGGRGGHFHRSGRSGGGHRTSRSGRPGSSRIGPDKVRHGGPRTPEEEVAHREFISVGLEVGDPDPGRDVDRQAGFGVAGEPEPDVAKELGQLPPGPKAISGTHHDVGCRRRGRTAGSESGTKTSLV